MDTGKYNSGSHNKDESSEINPDDIDLSKTVDINRDIELENLIKADIMNIDTMKEENKDGAFAAMKQKEDKPEALKEKMIASSSDSMKQKVNDSLNGYVEISMSNLIIPVLFFIGTLTYLELIMHVINYHSIDFKLIYPVLFSIPLGMMFGFITGIFKPAVNRVLIWVLTGALCLNFAIQLIYFYIFKVYFSFQSLGMAGDAVSEFSSDIVTAVRANILKLLLILLPMFVLGILFRGSLNFAQRTFKLQAVLLGSALVFHMVALVALLLFGKGDYSPYDLYYNTKVMDLCGKELGITTMTRIDIGNIFGGNQELVLDDLQPGQTDITAAITTAPTKAAAGTSGGAKATPTAAPADTGQNVINIDFKALAQKENNATYKKLDEYFAASQPTNKNKYTGMFKGYNLILITAEGFSPFAVNKAKTPTLYKLTKEGFVFNNFYTALWQTSTSDGEYCALTGLIPTGIRNMYKGRNNLWPFSLGNQFDKLGIASKAYHNNTYTYYERNLTHPNLGYIFKAKGNGLKLEHPNYWPESDLEMINSTVDEYIGEKQFHVYYMTVSGHMNYNFTGNMMSYKNRALVEDLPYSDDVKAYIACQSELDKALEQLIQRLEKAGVADHTVIALSADHYPYAWDKKIINEAAGHEVGTDFEIYRNKFILWSEGMKKNVVIDKPCSSLDILPTLSNLFGLTYDSRLLAGQDILSDAEPLVILANHSFITDKVMYNAKTGKTIELTDETLPEDYISKRNRIVKNKFAVSKSILEDDYYRHIFGNSQ